MSATQQSGATHLFGIVSIARFVGLDEGETARRIASGELPCTFTSGTKMAIASKVDLKAIRESAHWNRHRAAA